MYMQHTADLIIDLNKNQGQVRVDYSYPNGWSPQLGPHIGGFPELKLLWSKQYLFFWCYTHHNTKMAYNASYLTGP